jgi:hypothetical protein
LWAKPHLGRFINEIGEFSPNRRCAREDLGLKSAIAPPNCSRYYKRNSRIQHGFMPDSQDSEELMYVKCAYCGQWLDVKPGKMNLISHAICPDCFEKEIQERNDNKPTSHNKGDDT